MEPLTRAGIFLLCGLLTACAEPKCGGSDLKYYDQALVHQLSKRGIRAVRSLDAEELAANRRRLSSAPKGAAC